LTAVDPATMVAGYVQAQRGRAQYSGVLRNHSKSIVLWTCPDDHKTATSARRCAETELERRLQGQRSVVTLAWCEPCRTWWTPAQASGHREPREDRLLGLGCPRCDFHLEIVKLVVLERRTVS
jgi:hypothetical protein